VSPSVTNEALFDRARRAIPGGVNSPVRAFGSVGGTPYFADRAEGGFVWDVEGTRYVDLVQSYGAIILGHAHPDVVAAVTGAAARGTSYGAPTAAEVRLAEAITSRVPSCEQVRLVSSGTEATMSAIRLARGFTGRDKIIKFAGNYHGHADLLLAAAGSGVATLGLPGSAGVPDGAVAQTLVAPYNEVPEVGDDVACVIVEPVAANMGVIAPADGFLGGLRAACDAAGALLVFDEVITGFRLGPAGAQGQFGVTPDLSTWGKVIGGGLPVGAFGGRADVMAALAPDGPVYQAGTLSGNPLATAAGLATLDLLDDAAYATLTTKATRLGDGLQGAFTEGGLPVRVIRVGPLLGLFMGDETPHDFDGAQRTDEAAYAALFHALLDRGVALAPGAYEALFVWLAHDDEQLDRVVEAAAEAAHDLARSGVGSASNG
jgi:glutamate-1-semialdehyde 2,1-aminomutase